MSPHMAEMVSQPFTAHESAAKGARLVRVGAGGRKEEWELDSQVHSGFSSSIVKEEVQP